MAPGWKPSRVSNRTLLRRESILYCKYFDPLLVGRRPNRHYTESNAWQYIWSVQHDAAGLIELLGGNENFNQRLDNFFEMSPVISPPKYVGVVGTIGQYVHRNQPSHHVAYLYNYAGTPWKAQQAVRKVTEDLYPYGTPAVCVANEKIWAPCLHGMYSAAWDFITVLPGKYCLYDWESTVWSSEY